MRRLLTLLVILASAISRGETPLTSIKQLKASLARPSDCGRSFDITGRVSYVIRANTGWMVSVSDDINLMFYELRVKPRPEVDHGDAVRIRGRIVRFNRELLPEYDSIDVLARPSGDDTREISAKDFYSGTSLNQQVRLRGVVRECFRDECDPNWIYLALVSEGTIVYAIAYSPPDESFRATDLIGETASVRGFCNNATGSLRSHSSRVLLVTDTRHIELPRHSDCWPFDAPPIDAIEVSTPLTLMSLGKRRVRGSVVALWNGNSALVRTDGDSLVNLTFDQRTLPGWGEGIEAVGIPGTDLYRLNLSHAVWRPAALPPIPPSDAAPCSIRTLLTDSSGRTMIDASAHGRRIALSGIVRHLPSDERIERCIFIESDGFLVPIDVSSAAGVLRRLAVGCTVNVRGTCLIECDTWSPNNITPRAKGIRLAVRADEDIAVLVQPPWWTPARIWSALGLLLAALLGIIAWNVALRRLVQRRGRELAREQISRAEAELRIGERTRLAVELHDTLSQNLMGVAMRLNAVKRAAAPYGEALGARITALANALKMSRAELKSCLYDLRSDALEEPDMERAIRQTLAPHVGDETAVAIRFNVPRQRLTDQTAHALLRIIRELTVNAIHHGQARHIRIAGSLDSGRLLFSVQDDGCGFDTDAIAGPSDGHFGLQGIRERIALLGGTMEIRSTVGKGSKVTLVLANSRTHTIPGENEQD